MPKRRMVARAPSSEGGTRMMTDGEWESFWDILDARRQRREQAPQSESDNEPDEEGEEQYGGEAERASVVACHGLPSDSASARRRTMRANRCGSCTACRAKDCGSCKNCLDKPRFGGPGVKKKACMARVCHQQPQVKEADDYSDPETAPVSPVLASSAPPQPGQPAHERGRPCASPPLDRRPLLPLDMQSTLSSFNFHGVCSLDLLSQAVNRSAAPMAQF